MHQDNATTFALHSSAIRKGYIVEFHRIWRQTSSKLRTTNPSLLK